MTTITQERSTGIGGTDAPALLNVHPYKTQFELYHEKIGSIEEKDLSQIEAVRWGTLLEPVIAKEYCERTGRKIKPGRRFRRHSKHHFLICHLDRIIVDPERGEGLLEIKTTNERNAKYWQDEEDPPIHGVIQLQHGLLVTESFKWGSLVVLVGGQAMRWWDFDADEEWNEIIIKEGRIFWDRVEKRMPPIVTEADAKLIQSIYPHAVPNSMIELGHSFVEIDKTLQRYKAEAKELQEHIDYYETLIKNTIGENEAGRLGNVVYTWKNQKRKGYTVPEGEFRVLRRKERKP